METTDELTTAKPLVEGTIGVGTTTLTSDKGNHFEGPFGEFARYQGKQARKPQGTARSTLPYPTTPLRRRGRRDGWERGYLKEITTKHLDKANVVAGTIDHIEAR